MIKILVMLNKWVILNIINCDVRKLIVKSLNYITIIEKRR